MPEVPENIENIDIDGEEKKEEVEMRKTIVGVRRVAPTMAEMEAHYPLHSEYRSWLPIVELERRGWHRTYVNRPTARSWTSQ